MRHCREKITETVQKIVVLAGKAHDEADGGRRAEDAGAHE